MDSCKVLANLSGSLQEIYSATKEGEPLALIASPWGHIYGHSSFFGRVFSLYHHIASYLLSKDTKALAFAVSVEKIKTLFKTANARFMSACTKMEDALKDLHEAKDSDKQIIHLWHQRIAPLLLEIKSVPKAFSFLKKCKALSSPLESVIVVEEILKQKLPYALLKKASLENLQKKEGGQLSLFVKTLNPLKAKDLNTCFKALTSLFSKDPLLKETSFWKLKKNLLKAGFNHDFRPDTLQLAWRKSTLFSGNVLQSSLGKITLGPKLGRPHAPDFFVTYSIKEHKTLVVRSAANIQAFPLLKQFSKELGFGVPAAKIHSVENEGQFALVEKLTEVKEDTQLIAFLTWCQEKDQLPHPLCLHKLLVNERGMLRAASQLKPKEFNFCLLEKQLKDFCKQDERRFSSLMKKSGLLKHQDAAFLENIAVLWLEEKTDDLEFLISTCPKRDLEQGAKKLLKQLEEKLCSLELEFPTLDCKKHIKSLYLEQPARSFLAVN